MKLAAFYAACAVVLAGCSGHGATASSSYSPYTHSYTIPTRHMPSPGTCRIWFPERSPADQPPQGDCAILRERVPAGAFLVKG